MAAAATKADKEIDVASFLIYLAIHANPNRFMPFPNKYRNSVTPLSSALVPSTEPPTVVAADVGSIRLARQAFRVHTMDEKLDSSFEPYTQQEYDRMRADLLDLEKNPLAHKALLKYICTLEIGIVRHNAKSIHPNIVEYEFKYSQLEERIRQYKYPKNRWFLFHGSPLGNWHSILRTGIKNMSNTRFMSSGAASGPGVYLTTALSTAMGYGTTGKISCVAVVEVLSDPAPYDKGGCVYVIPDDKILVARYLYRITNSSHMYSVKGDEVLQYYKKIAEGKLAVPKHIGSRLEEEAKELNITERNDLIWTVLIDNALFRIYLDGFPFLPPMIQPVYYLNKHDNTTVWIHEEWNPMTSIKELTAKFKDACFPDGIPEMTTKEVPLLQDS
jgi:hypothetical protein